MEWLFRNPAVIFTILGWLGSIVSVAFIYRNKIDAVERAVTDLTKAMGEHLKETQKDDTAFELMKRDVKELNNDFELFKTELKTAKNEILLEVQRLFSNLSEKMNDYIRRNDDEIHRLRDRRSTDVDQVNRILGKLETFLSKEE